MPEIEVGMDSASQPLNDESPMPYGKFAGRPMKDVPSDYLDWCLGQDWFARKYPEVADYVARNLKVIQDDIPDDD